MTTYADPDQLGHRRHLDGMPAALSLITGIFTDTAERQRAIGLWAGLSGSLSITMSNGVVVPSCLYPRACRWWGPSRR